MFMKRSLRETLVRVLLLFVGLTIAHFGVTLFLLADAGSDPFNVLIQGLFRALSHAFPWGFLTHGNTHVAVCFLIILILLFVDRSYIKIGTLLCMICGGPIIDIFTGILSPFFTERPSFPGSLLILAVACVILAFGMTIVIKSDAGTGPNDLVAVVISDKLHKSFSVIRILVDLSFVAIGFLLGGSVGIGTIVCAGLVGPVAGFFLPLHDKWMPKFIQTFTVKKQP